MFSPFPGLLLWDAWVSPMLGCVHHGFLTLAGVLVQCSLGANSYFVKLKPIVAGEITGVSTYSCVFHFSACTHLSEVLGQSYQNN